MQQKCGRSSPMRTHAHPDGREEMRHPTRDGWYILILSLAVFFSFTRGNCIRRQQRHNPNSCKRSSSVWFCVLNKPNCSLGTSSALWASRMHSICSPWWCTTTLCKAARQWKCPSCFQEKRAASVGSKEVTWNTTLPSTVPCKGFGCLQKLQH